nr:hypothetical protein [Candidatus Levybacteria bacterium]
MTNPENPAFNLSWQRFEAYPTYGDLDRAPKTVVTQTDSMIQLLNAGVVPQDLIQNYLLNYTVPFLVSAANGIKRVYDQEIASVISLPVETSEAADFTNIVFSWMHYFARSRYLPDGFSKRGILRAPQTEREFIRRIVELKDGVLEIADGKKSRGTFLESSPQALRIYTFFKVGSSMPLKFIESDRERREHESDILGKLLDGIDTSFST